MKYYITDNGLRAIGEDFDIDGDQSFLVEPSWVELTDEQIERHKSGLYEWVDGEQVLKSKSYDEELAELNTEYDESLSALSDEYNKAVFRDGVTETAKVAAVRVKLSELETWYSEQTESLILKHFS